MIPDDATITAERAAILRLARAAEELRDALDALATCPLCTEGAPHHAEDCPVPAVTAALSEVIGA